LKPFSVDYQFASKMLAEVLVSAAQLQAFLAEHPEMDGKPLKDVMAQITGQDVVGVRMSIQDGGPSFKDSAALMQKTHTDPTTTMFTLAADPTDPESTDFVFSMSDLFAYVEKHKLEHLRVCSIARIMEAEDDIFICEERPDKEYSRAALMRYLLQHPEHTAEHDLETVLDAIDAADAPV
jgi:hypothetical protein